MPGTKSAKTLKHRSADGRMHPRARELPFSRFPPLGTLHMDPAFY